MSRGLCCLEQLDGFQTMGIVIFHESPIEETQPNISSVAGIGFWRSSKCLFIHSVAAYQSMPRYRMRWFVSGIPVDWWYKHCRLCAGYAPNDIMVPNVYCYSGIFRIHGLVVFMLRHPETIIIGQNFLVLWSLC